MGYAEDMAEDMELHEGDPTLGPDDRDLSPDVCILCGENTDTVYNINLKPVSICNDCGLSITKQEVSSWGRQNMNEKPLRIMTSEIMILITTWRELGLRKTGHPEEEPEQSLEALWEQLLPLIKRHNAN